MPEPLNTSDLANTFDLTSLIKESTYYKKSEKQSSIGLILTNKPHSFQISCVVETSLSDFHRTILTAKTMTFQKLRPPVTNYRDYKHFNNKNCRKDLMTEISNSCLRFDDSGFNEVLDLH